MEATVEWFQP